MPFVLNFIIDIKLIYMFNEIFMLLHEIYAKK